MNGVATALYVIRRETAEGVSYAKEGADHWGALSVAEAKKFGSLKNLKSWLNARGMFSGQGNGITFQMAEVVRRGKNQHSMTSQRRRGWLTLEIRCPHCSLQFFTAPRPVSSAKGRSIACPYCWKEVDILDVLGKSALVEAEAKRPLAAVE